jgi:hypothetical protein
MSDEQTRVLEMVATGKISVEDGSRLLEALASPPPSEAAGWAWAPPTAPTPPTPPAPPVPPVPPRPGHASKARIGATGFTFEQLAHLANVGIDAKFVRKFRQAGLEDLGFDELVHLGHTGVDPKEFKRLRKALDAAGIEPSFEAVVHGLMMGVDFNEISELIDALGDSVTATVERDGETTVIRTTITRDEPGDDGDHTE